MKQRQRLVQAICEMVRASTTDPQQYMEIRESLERSSMDTLRRIAGGGPVEVLARLEAAE